MRLHLFLIICAFVPLVATAETELIKAAFESACARTGLLLSKAAAWMQIDHGQLRRQLDGDGRGLALVAVGRLPRSTRQAFFSDYETLLGGRMRSDEDFEQLRLLLSVPCRVIPMRREREEALCSSL